MAENEWIVPHMVRGVENEAYSVQNHSLQRD